VGEIAMKYQVQGVVVEEGHPYSHQEVAVRQVKRRKKRK
jgi:hypothetical protein